MDSPILLGAGPVNEQTQSGECDLLDASEHENMAQGCAPEKSRWASKDTPTVLS